MRPLNIWRHFYLLIKMFINSLSVKKKKRLGEKRIAGELSTEQVNLNIDTKESYKHSFKRN